MEEKEMATMKIKDGTIHYNDDQQWYGGDSFNRDYATCSYIAPMQGEISFGVDAACAKGALDSLSGTCDSFTLAHGNNSHAEGCNTIAINSSINTLDNQLGDIKARIDALEDAIKKKSCAANSLRGALKTLQYKREVE
jgi:hypothetical protein